jgi:hypothetical protein
VDWVRTKVLLSAVRSIMEEDKGHGASSSSSSGISSSLPPASASTKKSSSSPIKLARSSQALAKMMSTVHVNPHHSKFRRRVIFLDSDSSSDEFETSSDEEVLEVDPGKDDYVELPRAKGEPPPETMELSYVTKERLGGFRNVYLSQPQHVKEMMKIYFYKGEPVVKPPPLASFIQKVKGYRMGKKRDKMKKKKELEERYSEAYKTAGITPKSKKKGKKLKEAKVNKVEVHETDTQLIHVDYPGRVVNPDKAMATMGGECSINKVIRKKKQIWRKS